MDKLKDGSSSFRQALILGHAGVLEDWAVCSCFCSQLPGARLGLPGGAGCAQRGEAQASHPRLSAVVQSV